MLLLSAHPDWLKYLGGQETHLHIRWSNPSLVSSVRTLGLTQTSPSVASTIFLAVALPFAGSQNGRSLLSISQTLNVTYGACTSYPHNQIKSF